MLKSEDILFVILKDLRTKSQQTVYLLQEMGIPLGFKYEWRGSPYSPRLVEVLDDMEHIDKGVKEKLWFLKLTKKSQDIVNRFKNINEKLLKVVCSISFLEKYAFIPKGENIRDCLREKFSESEIEEGYKIYKMYILFENHSIK